jgi:hypothetical protein
LEKKVQIFRDFAAGTSRTPATIWSCGRKTGSGSFSNSATAYIQMLFTREFKELAELLNSNRV